MSLIHSMSLPHSLCQNVFCPAQVRKLTGLGQKKAHLIEIQVNGGTTNDKVDFATKLFEKVSRGHCVGACVCLGCRMCLGACFRLGACL
jgi:hypothetical protein